MPILPDGSVVPSFVGITRTASSYDGDAFDNGFLRVGEVQEVIYPDDDRSRSKKFIEYRVLVQQRSNGTGNAKMYENCSLWNSLAGLADRLEFTLRADTSANRDKNGLGKGSKVLVMCVNGEANTAVIMGGVRDEVDTDYKVKGLDDTKVKDLGHHLYFNFNGISFYVNKDGECVLSYNGKTKIDGSTDVGTSKTGSGFKLLKNGNVRVEDRDGKNALVIDHENGKVLIARDKAFEVGDATDKMLLGSTYRDAQNDLHNDLIRSFGDVRTFLNTAATQLQIAGNAMAVPVTGAVAAGPNIVSAANMIMQASLRMEQIAQAMKDFEYEKRGTTGSLEDSDRYLSKKNKLD